MKNRTEYDLIIIGGGPAGTPVAMEYAALNRNKKILLIDKKGELGGECLFDGCIPSKILEVAAKYMDSENKMSFLGIRHSKFNIDWDVITARKKTTLSKRTNTAKRKLLSFGNIKLMKGEASFNNNISIKVKKSDGSVTIIYFKKAVIATGSRTLIPHFKGNGIDKVWTNVTFFDKMKLPRKLTIIGDGPIGIELSQIISRLNVKVDLIGDKDTILPMIDTKYSNLILNRMKLNKNINLVLNSNVNAINYHNNKFEIKYFDKDSEREREIVSSKVLIATGRTPNIEELDLKNASVNSTEKGIVVNDYLQTTNKNIYCAGDVALGFPQFAHTASYGAHIIAQNLFFQRNKFKTNFNKNSWVLFTSPNFASAGLSRERAKELRLKVIIGEYDYSIDARAQIENNNEGYLRFIVNRKNLEILGINILHENANEIAGEAALIVSKKITLIDLANSIHPHPTLSESFSFLAKKMMAEIMGKGIKNPMFKIGFFVKKWL